MNFEVMLLIAISLLVKFGDGMIKRLDLLKTTVRGTFVKGEEAERKFAYQLQHRNALIDAAFTKATGWQDWADRYTDDSTSSWSWIDDIVISYIQRRATSTRQEYDKLDKKYREPEEAFCKLSLSEAGHICADAFQNPYFEEEKLTYPSGSPYADATGFLIMKMEGRAKPIKYRTKFKKCVAEKDNGDGSKTTINVYLKASDKWKEGRRLKFFVIFASEKDPEANEFNVGAYLKNK